jgi:hypothetical protein
MIIKIKKSPLLNFQSDSHILSIVYGLSLIQALTGFQNMYVNTIYVSLILFALLILPAKDSIKILPIIIVYFGFTYINMHIIGNIEIANSTLTKIVFLIIGLKVITLDTKVLIKGNYLFLSLFALFLFLQRLIYGQISSAVISCLTICVVILFLEKVQSDEKEIRVFILLFVISLASVYIYNLLYIDTVRIYSGLDNWRAYQFVGVRDPNNFSLQANFCLAYVLMKKVFKRWQTAIVVFLVISSFITVSLSGILTTIAIFSVYYFKELKYKTIKTIISIFVVCLLLSITYACMGDYGIISGIENDTVRAIVSRAEYVYENLEEGDLSRVTSNRSDLWVSYWNLFNRQDLVQQMFGDPSTLIHIHYLGQASSHNAWIDTLLNNGWIGTMLLLFCCLKRMLIRWKSGDQMFILITIIFMINIFARSISGMFMYLLIL